MLAARQRQTAAAPGASRASGARVKVGNLTPGISTVNLKDALQMWGISGISHIEKPQGSFGKEAVVHFKKETDAELMLQASGIQVEGRACTITPMAKLEKASKVDVGSAGSQGGPPAAVETNLMKVVGMKNGTEQQDLITFLRGRGVLGIVEVVARGSTGLVRFQHAEHVKAAVMKADGGIMGREKNKLTLQAIDQAEWLRVLTEQIPLEAPPVPALPRGGLAGFEADPGTAGLGGGIGLAGALARRAAAAASKSAASAAAGAGSAGASDAAPPAVAPAPRPPARGGVTDLFAELGGGAADAGAAAAPSAPAASKPAPPPGSDSEDGEAAAVRMLEAAMAGGDNDSEDGEEAGAALLEAAMLGAAATEDTVEVSNLPEKCSADALRRALREKGLNPFGMDFSMDPKGTRCKVTFRTDKEASQALAVDSASVDGRKIKIKPLGETYTGFKMTVASNKSAPY